MAKKVKSAALFVLLLAVFLGMFAAFGPGLYNDSDQYMKMHIHREPLYPIFLLLLRTICGEGEGWLILMGIIQNMLAAFSIWYMAEYVGRRFRLCLWQEAAVAVIGILPYVTTIFFSALHLVMTNGVMSEGVCLPLFTIYMTECFKMAAETERRTVGRAAAVSLCLAFVLSLTRSQMMLTILMWLVVLGAKIVFRKPQERDGKGTGLPRKALGGRLLRVSAAAGAVACVFVLRLLAVKSYNLVFNGHFINNTYGPVNTLTNILYSADREDGERIGDEEARDFFYRMYDLTEDRQANYKYAGDSLREKTEHIEEWHDTIKYEMIEDVFYQTYDKYVTSDYIIQNLMADETAGKIMKGILPGCFPRWCVNYLLIARYGLIRSIAVVHPVLNWVAACIYLSAFVLMGLAYRKDKKSRAVRVMAVALLAVAANVAAVSITIMCLSRYMIYGFVPFYTAYFLLLTECYRGYIGCPAGMGKRSLRELRGRNQDRVNM